MIIICSKHIINLYSLYFWLVRALDSIKDFLRISARKGKKE